MSIQTTDSMSQSAMTFRYAAQALDRIAVRTVVDSTGFFSAAEADVAAELVDERLVKGFASGYFFVFAERDDQLCGYTCYGPIACTVASYDLYWIVVDKAFQRGGLGRKLIEESERMIREHGGQRVYIETSNRAQYEPTRAFYERCGYSGEAVLADFYAPGDDKVIYVKTL